MFEKNTNQVNKIIAKSLAFCSVVFAILFILTWTHVFNFNRNILTTLATLGLWTTLSPIVLVWLGVKDKFIQYYTLILMAILIAHLASDNGIGIYISFILVPIVSCLYLDWKFTVQMSAVAYIAMVVGVYFNAAGKMEVTYLNWSHMETFVLYIIGFTLEFIVASVFLYWLVKRASGFMRKQQETLLSLKAQTIRYQLLVRSSKDIIVEYFVDEDRYVANRSLYAAPEEGNLPVEIKNFSQYIDSDEEQLRQAARLLQSCMEADNGIYEECELSYKRNGARIPLWMQIEAFQMRDESGKIISIIAKFHDITRAKEMQKEIKQRRMSDVYADSMDKSKKSIYDLVVQQSQYFDEEDFARLAQGHQFIARVLDEMKYAKDMEASLNAVLAKIGEFFGADRIAAIDADMAGGTCSVTYQWTRQENLRLPEDMSVLSRDELQLVFEEFDRKGCIEINPKHGIMPEFIDADEKMKGVLSAYVLGSQMWIPILNEGEYSGTFCVDRYSVRPYRVTEKYLLSELTETLASYINRMKAERANQAKSVFLSSMSHEIRTPMNAILGMSEVALREDMNDTTRKCLSIIKSSSTGLLSLINDILDISKIEAGRIEIVPEKYDTLSLMNDVCTIIRARNTEKELELRFMIPEDLPAVLEGDMVRIKQIMVNLATNAIKYTDHGSVEIRVGCDRPENGMVNMSFSVKDTGMGIRQEDLDKLFKNYSQVDIKKNHHKEGTGLGLYICKQMVDLMNGTIQVESEYGKGSTFSFVLPQRVIDDRKAGKLEDYTYTGNADQQGYLFKAPRAKVLLADDNKVNRTVALALFKPLQMQMDVAADGLEALNKAQAQKYDLILMDHFMPVLDGEECTEKIRGLEGNPNQKVPIIALTADAISGVKEKLLACGMNDFISKPIDLPTACQKIRRWLPEDKIEE